MIPVRVRDFSLHHHIQISFRAYPVSLEIIQEALSLRGGVARAWG